MFRFETRKMFRHFINTKNNFDTDGLVMFLLNTVLNHLSGLIVGSPFHEKILLMAKLSRICGIHTNCVP